jgi:hypothetical protein
MVGGEYGVALGLIALPVSMAPEFDIIFFVVMCLCFLVSLVVNTVQILKLVNEEGFIIMESSIHPKVIVCLGSVLQSH